MGKFLAIRDKNGFPIAIPSLVLRDTGGAVTVTEEVVTRGLVADTADALDHLAAQITEVKQGATTFAVTDDYLLTDGEVDWSPAAPGTEPLAESDYLVTYKYLSPASIVIPHIDGLSIMILGFAARYSTANTGTLTYADGVKTIDYEVVNSKEFEYHHPVVMAVGADVAVSLTSGGLTVTDTLTVFYNYVGL